MSSEELMQYLGKQFKTAVLGLEEILGYHFTLAYNGARFKPMSTDENGIKEKRQLSTQG